MNSNSIQDQEIGIWHVKTKWEQFIRISITKHMFRVYNHKQKTDAKEIEMRIFSHAKLQDLLYLMAAYVVSME